MAIVDDVERVKIILNRHGIPDDNIRSVIDSYSAGWRTYHNCAHISAMLTVLDGLHIDVEDRPDLEFMIVYHDVWYKLGRRVGENEQESANWAMRDLRKVKDDYSPKRVCCDLVVQGIIATSDHSLRKVNDEYKEIVSILLDIDLWGIGQSVQHFNAVNESIWKEFEPIYTRSEYDKNRKDWASMLLRRDKIYNSAYFVELEQIARQNLKHMVESI